MSLKAPIVFLLAIEYYILFGLNYNCQVTYAFPSFVEGEYIKKGDYILMNYGMLFCSQTTLIEREDFLGE